MFSMGQVTGRGQRQTQTLNTDTFNPFKNESPRFNATCDLLFIPPLVLWLLFFLSMILAHCTSLPQWQVLFTVLTSCVPTACSFLMSWSILFPEEHHRRRLLSPDSRDGLDQMSWLCTILLFNDNKRPLFNQVHCFWAVTDIGLTTHSRFLLFGGIFNRL